jgi:hypothetical protein
MKSPDEICDDYSNKGVKLSVRQIEKDYILIEGDTDSLEFLGNLLLAQANFEKDCGLQIAPNGAGSSFFGKDSTFGFYIHRLPCKHSGNQEQK